MWMDENPNPLRKDVGDCAVRAISLATDRPWEDIYIALCVQGAMQGDMPNSNSVWGSYLTHHGWSYHPLEHTFDASVDDFCKEHPQGVFIVGTGDHAVCVKNGIIYDTWNSGNKVPIYYFIKDE